MKKTSLLSLFALSSIALTACGATTQTPTEEKVESPLQKHLRDLRTGVKLSGTYHQTRTFYKDNTFEQQIQTSEATEGMGNVEFGFNDGAFFRKIDTVMGDEVVPYTAGTYIKDEQGYAYQEYLSYENKIEKDYEMAYGNKCSFVNLGFENPFASIYENDLKFDEKTKLYSLDLTKASDMFSTLLGFYAKGIYNKPESCVIDTNEKGEFTAITYKLTPRYVEDYNSMAGTTSYYITEQTVDLMISTLEDGTIVDRIEPIKADNSAFNKTLDNALKNFNGNNVQVTVIDQPTGGTQITKQYSYDGKSVYVKHYNPTDGGSINVLDAKNDYILALNENLPLYEARGYDEELSKWVPSNTTKFGKTSQDKYVYSDLVFDFSKISSDLFKYDQSKNVFVCDNIAALDVAAKGLQPIASELQNSNLSHTDKVSIKLDSKGAISSIVAHYSFFNSYTFEKVEGEVNFRLRGIGSTSLPFGAVVENIGGTK